LVHDGGEMTMKGFSQPVHVAEVLEFAPATD
jgi:class 3 adenylate cyclase